MSIRQWDKGWERPNGHQWEGETIKNSRSRLKKTKERPGDVEKRQKTESERLQEWNEELSELKQELELREIIIQRREARLIKK